MNKKELSYKTTPDGKVKISINVPLMTVKRMDHERKKNNKTRSTWITQIIMEKLAEIKN